MGSCDLIDIGANLADGAFGSDRDAVIERARVAGVRRMVLTGTSVEQSRAALEIARGYPGRLFATAGVHPHHAKSCGDATIGELRALCGEPGVVAVGECGLDFFRDLSPRPAQERWFAAQLELAAEVGLPVFVHERDAFPRLAEILGEHRARLGEVVVHCFTGHGDALDAYLGLDLHIGITGWICDERRGLHLRELVRRIPDDRLMLETDSPYLLPRTIRPRPRTRRNEPANLTWVLETVAECRRRSPAEVAAAATSTAERFFAVPG